MVAHDRPGLGKACLTLRNHGCAVFELGRIELRRALRRNQPPTRLAVARRRWSVGLADPSLPSLSFWGYPPACRHEPEGEIRVIGAFLSDCLDTLPKCSSVTEVKPPVGESLPLFLEQASRLKSLFRT